MCKPGYLKDPAKAIGDHRTLFKRRGNSTMTDIRKTHLYQEIHEQPQVLYQLIDRESQAVIELANVIRRSGISHVVIAARGSSDNVGRYAKYLLGAANGLSVGLATPSLFTIYQQVPKFRNALVLGISQSGQSPDIVAVLEEAKKQGVLTVAITNDIGSPLAQNADHAIQMNAGVEKSVAATKTYTSSLMIIAMLSAGLAGASSLWEEIRAIPEATRQTLELDQAALEAATRWRFADRCVVIGRGYNYATAFELALKLKELTYIIAEPYSPADLLHGPFAIVERDFPVLVIAPHGVMLPNISHLLSELHQAGADSLIISDDEETMRLGDARLHLPYRVPEWLSPITAVIAGQLFAIRLTTVKKLDVDQPRGLRKVTRTY
jgi:glucosamine--fructose-6-phosphate aminotransferase (isomerizing)